MNLTTVSPSSRPAAHNTDAIGGYRVSKHARIRMAERRVSAKEVSALLKSDRTWYQVDWAGVAQYRGSVRERPIRVTVNELANVIVTVAALVPWFLSGASVGTEL